MTTRIQNFARKKTIFAVKRLHTALLVLKEDEKAGGATVKLVSDI